MTSSAPRRLPLIHAGGRRYGDAVARSLGLPRAPLLTSRALPRAQMTVAHHQLEATHVGLTPRIPAEDTFVVALYLTDVPYHELWHGDRPRIAQGYARSSLRIVHLGDDCSARITDPHEAVTFYVPRSLVDGFAEEHGAGSIGHLTCAPGHVDPILYHLAGALLPALGAPNQADPLFVDHVALAVLTHLTARYSGGQVRPSLMRSALPKAVLRALQDFLVAQMEGRPTLGELAEVSGLSRAHVARAFKDATGLSPHRWLQRHRVNVAKHLLRQTVIPISQVATQCGFVDQSHLTRVFAAHVGVTPGEWRRVHRG